MEPFVKSEHTASIAPSRKRIDFKKRLVRVSSSRPDTGGNHLGTTSGGTDLLDDVEAQIADGRRLLIFRPRIEALYLKEYEANRLRLAPIWALVGTAVYDLLSLGDRAMMADVAMALTVARFAVFTPFVLLSMLLLRFFPSARAYDFLSITIALVGTLAPMSVLIYSKSPYAYAYQTGSISTFLFFAVALRPRMPSTVLGLTLLCAAQLTAVKLNGSFEPVIYSGIVSFYVTVSVFLALSVHFMEQKERSSFLHQLRGQLLVEKLERKSERDELTGLLNRHGLTRWREKIWSDHGGSRAISAIMLDIDRFKLYNDVHGHLEGDRCLHLVSQCVSHAVEGNGHTFRFGGEEILVLVPGVSLEEAGDLAERIRASIEGAGIVHRGLEAGRYVTASFGVASGRTDTLTLDGLMIAADAALYEAKENGRNKVAAAPAKI